MAFGSLLYTSDNDKIKGSENLETLYDKSKIRLTYSDFFANLTKSLFLFGSLKDTMRSSFLNSLLIDYGSFAFVDDDEYGIVATPYSTCKLFDLNGYPTQIQAIAPPNCDTTLEGRIYNSDKFVIVKLNPQGIPLRSAIMYFCDKIVENQRAIDVNVFACQTPVIYEVSEGNEKTVSKLITDMKKMVKAIVLKRDRGARADDLIKTTPTPDFKGDKFITNIQYYEGELYNFCGFKHTPFEKRERLLAAEVTSNDEILNTTKAMMYRTVQEGINETNKKFGTDFTVEYTLTNRNSNFDVVLGRETETSNTTSSEVTEEGFEE